MKIVMMGNVRLQGEGEAVQGMVIEATPEELRAHGQLLYQNVDVVPSDAKHGESDPDYGSDFYVIEMGQGERDVTRNKMRVFEAAERLRADSRPLTRKDIYRHRYAAGECEYAHAFMCSGYRDEGTDGRPMREEWLSERPYPFEVDEFLSEKLFGGGNGGYAT